MAIPNLRQWQNGEIFNARDYVYERNVLIAEINRLEGLLTNNSSISANTVSANEISTGAITMNGQRITSFAEAGTKIHYETLSNPRVDDLFIDYD